VHGCSVLDVGARTKVVALELATDCCVLRPVTADDARGLHELWASPGVRRFLWDDEIVPFGRPLAAIERSVRLFEERHFGMWGAWRHGASGFIGFGGLWPFRDPPEFELVYGVAQDMWGEGYATEIAQAVTGYCLGSLQMSAVCASTNVANRRSIRVLDKLGFRFVRRDIVGGLDTAFYELAKEARVGGTVEAEGDDFSSI
jgi:ribosomal-protein-alanine N-acetyltransferase